AVEGPYEILAAGSARLSARIEVDVEDPPRLGRTAVHGQREEVGTLPYAAGRAGRAEVAEDLPSLQVGRAEEAHLVHVGQHRHHHPAPRGRVPEHLGIAEVLEAEIDDGVAGVFLPGAAAVGAEGEVLGLLALAVA